jgi:glycosyltransferase involved in cell wall biosynthesis
VRSARVRVLMVCNGWGPRKNGEAGLLAYGLLRERLPEVELHLFGSGTEEGGAAWQQWRGQGAPGQVVFNGAVAHAAVLEAMAASDLMLHPALEESFGAVLAEAMSAGLPVVAGRSSGAVPWVVGDAGMLVDVTRPQAMADAMLALLVDPEGLAALAQRGRERVASRFSPQAVAAQYEREYEFALSGAPSTQRVPA